MLKNIINRIVCFRNANKKPFNNFTIAWKEKSFQVLREERFHLTIWIVFGFFAVGIAIVFGNPDALIPDALGDAISLTLPGFLLFSGATIGLIPLLIRRNIFQKCADVGNVLMKGALHGAALLIGILLSFLIVGGLSSHEKPSGFYFIFSLGVVETAILMAYAIFGLSFSEAYKTFQPKLSHKLWLFSLFAACLYSTHYIFKN